MASTSSVETSKDFDEMKRELFKNVMSGDWEQVEKMYKENPEAHKAKITRSGYTALHLAVSNGKADVVEKLVKFISENNQPQEALGIKNERGYTALHFAAAMGNVRMCKCIASVDRSLVGIRNNEGETPLFWAVLYGQKQAFFSLHNIISNCPKKDAYSYCRKGSGETILHCAIYGEHFDLAFQIIILYENLVNYVDEEGFSPLEALAAKPSCFESGSNLRGWNKFIYKCIYIKELEEYKESTSTDNVCRYPENYQTFVNCFGTFALFIWQLLKNAFGIEPNKNKKDAENPEEYAHRGNQQTPSDGTTQRRDQLFPDNYVSCFEFFKLVYEAILIIFGFGYIREKKEKHVSAVQVLDALLKYSKLYDSIDLQSGANPGETGAIDRDHGEYPYSAIFEGDQKDHPKKEEKNEDEKATGKEHKGTAILIAAKNGISEIVEKILKSYPVAIHDVDENMKNILLVAAEHKQLQVYKLLLRHTEIPRDIVFRKVDNYRNSALHFAAMINQDNHKPWPIPGAALQMQWEIKWYKYVEESMPRHFFLRANKDGETPEEIFTRTHKKLVKDGGDWLTNTSTSCSVVATLIATVAFASSTTFPGGTDSRSGKPTLENQTSFQLFAASSLIALCFSVTSLNMFLAILTSRYQEKDFGKDLPRKLLIGLSSLFVSIASMITSFCAGHFIVLEAKLKYLAFPVYAFTFLPVCLFAIAQFPLYLDLFWATFLSPF